VRSAGKGEVGDLTHGRVVGRDPIMGADKLMTSSPQPQVDRLSLLTKTYVATLGAVLNEMCLGHREPRDIDAFRIGVSVTCLFIPSTVC
jgi:hypothetical protein